MTAVSATQPITCSTSNVTVANICCSQVNAAVSVFSGILPLSPSTAPFPTTNIPAGTPAPQVPLTTACQWVPASNSTGETEIHDWLSCADQYGKTTSSSVCTTPAPLTSSGRSQRSPALWISAMLLGGAVLQAVFAIQS